MDYEETQNKKGNAGKAIVTILLVCIALVGGYFGGKMMTEKNYKASTDNNNNNNKITEPEVKEPDNKVEVPVSEETKNVFKTDGGKTISIAYNEYEYFITADGKTIRNWEEITENQEVEIAFIKEKSNKKIVNAKVLSVECDITEAIGLVYEDGTVDKITFKDQNSLKYEKINMFKDYKIKEIISFTTSCGGPEGGTKAEVILQDGTTKTIKD